MKATVVTLAVICLFRGVNATKEDLKRCKPQQRDCMAISAPKEGSSPLCAMNGKIKTSNVLSSCKASTFDECRDTCLDSHSCKAFGYSTTSSKCSLLKEGLKNSLVRADGYDYGMMYFSRRCYDRQCSKPCANGLRRRQIVKNPGFEHDSNNFAAWLTTSTGKRQPETSHGFAPQGRTVAYWAPAEGDPSGASASFTQRLQRRSAHPEPFYFSAWVGEYGDGGYKPATVSVKLDGSEVVSPQRICAGAPYCQSFGTDALYRQLSGVGVMSSKSALLQVEFFTTNITTDSEHHVVYLDAVSVVGLECSDD